MTRNRLDQETSPYLLQHRDNPVHWQPWGPEAFARARDEDRPVLLSVGYAACHWCHVMAHESFEDEETAALMNEGFVNVKVDREERPDVDSIYQTALALMGQSGGWPLTLFLTPEGVPFWGGTYFPPSPRFDRPSFRDVLRKVAEIYRADPPAVTRTAEAMRSALERLSRPRGGGAVAPDIVRRGAAALLGHVDPVRGGLAGAPKFPQASAFELLWRGWKLTGERPYLEAVTRTLDHISLGGIFDHLGGGFARYSTDEAWLVPHFEKMLYDNAQLLDLLTLVWQETKSPLYAARIEETADWALREMTVEGGAFASSFDADSEGEEGRFYVWSEAEIDRLLGPDSDAFKEAYGVAGGGNWEGANVLHRAGPAFVDPDLEQRLAGARAVLREARERRVKPARDDKVIADWNGLMIAALANAGLVFDRPQWIDAAARAFTFVRDRIGADGRLRHSWCGGRSAHPGTLADHASMCRAALALWEASGEARYLDQAEGWVATGEHHFRDQAAGGYFCTADDTDDLITRTKLSFDAATPSGNAAMVAILARLSRLTGKADYRDRAEATAAVFAGELEAQPLAFTSLLNAIDLLERAVEVVIVGARGAPDTAALLGAVLGLSLPNRVLSAIAPGTALAPGHPAGGKGQADGRATAYVCRAGTCSAPVTDPAALARELGGP